MEESFLLSSLALCNRRKRAKPTRRSRSWNHPDFTGMHGRHKPSVLFICSSLLVTIDNLPRPSTSAAQAGNGRFDQGAGRLRYNSSKCSPASDQLTYVPQVNNESTIGSVVTLIELLELHILLKACKT